MTARAAQTPFALLLVGLCRALIEGVYARAGDGGAKRVCWQTRETNTAGRLLYDKVASQVGFIVYSHDA